MPQVSQPPWFSAADHCDGLALVKKLLGQSLDGWPKNMHNVAHMTAPARTSSLHLLAFIGRPPQTKLVRDTCEAAQKKLQREYSLQAIPALGPWIARLYDVCQPHRLACADPETRRTICAYEPRIKQNESLNTNPIR